MNKKKEKQDKGLIPTDFKGIMAFLKQPTIKIAEAITGILASDFKDVKLLTGRLIQASLKGKLYTQLGKELEKYIEEGQIKEDYFETSKNQASLYELLKYIDEEVPDEERFKAMKSIFLFSVSKGTNEQETALAYEFLQICKKLSSGDILVLKANYNLVIEQNTKGFSPDKNIVVEIWLNNIAVELGHKIPSLVEAHEEILMNMKLISERDHEEKSVFRKTDYFRLTSLGYKLCEFISKYE